MGFSVLPYTNKTFCYLHVYIMLFSPIKCLICIARLNMSVNFPTGIFQTVHFPSTQCKPEDPKKPVNILTETLSHSCHFVADHIFLTFFYRNDILTSIKLVNWESPQCRKHYRIIRITCLFCFMPFSKSYVLLV